MHAPKPPRGPLDASIFVEGLRAHAGKFVAAALVVHALLWTLAPLIGEPTPDPKLAVGLAIGREWLLGYPGLPPLAPWVLEIVYRWIPSVVVLKALGPIAVALAGWFVFGLARRIAGDRHGALATLIMVGVYPVAFPSGALDSTSIQMPLVAGLALVWWRAVHEGNREAWLLFGIVSALMFYAGAQGVVVLALLLFITFCTGGGRAAFRNHRSLAPSIAGLILFLTIAIPRLWWLATHGFSGFYEDTSPDFGLHGALQSYEALGAAFIGHLGLILLIVVATPVFAEGRNVIVMMRAPLHGFGLMTVFALALVPIVLVGGAVLAFDITTTAEAFAPLLLYSGLLAVVLAGDTIRICRQYLSAVIAAILLVLPPVLFVSAEFALPWASNLGLVTNWPAEQAARTMTGIFRTRTGKPLDILIGAPLLASEIALASPDRPHIFPNADPQQAPWIAEDTLRTKGAVVFWLIAKGNTAPPAALTAKLPPFVAEAPLTLPWRRGRGLDPVMLGWGMILPAK